MHRLQDLPPSVLLLVGQLLAPPLLKHAFRPPGYRVAHRSLVAASTTCHALRRTCFPLAIRIFRNHDPKPLCRADIGESANELEKRIEWLLTREDLWPHIRAVDIELFARGSCSLGTHIATLISSLPHLEQFAIRLPTYRVFRDALTSDLRSAFIDCPAVKTLCVDAHSAWLVPRFPNLRELVVWSWPKPVSCEEEEDRAGGWKVFLAGLNAQAPNVQELEIGGLSIWDVNELFPALANTLGNIQVLRVLHRSEPYGAVPIPSSLVPPVTIIPLSPSIRTMPLPSAIQSSTRIVWEDSQTDPEYEGQFILGHPGNVKKIIYFGLQDECGSCYVPRAGSLAWRDVGPVVVLSLEDMKDRHGFATTRSEKVPRDPSITLFRRPPLGFMAEIVIRKRPLADGQSSQRKFYKKTARGKVLKVLRERYVRDDIQCGVEKCETCYDFTEGDRSPLSSTGDLTHTQFPSGHFIIPDTNVFLHQMDLIESPLFVPPIIILQTVIDEVRHRSLPLHSRLKGLIASEDKRIYVFYNEFHAQTAVARQPEESPNDRNDRGIRLSAAWYAKHYSTAWSSRSSSLPEIVLLTDDAENRRRAAGDGIKTLSVREYVSGTKNSAALLDLLAAESMEGEEDTTMKQGRKKVLYEEYLPQATLVAGVKVGDLYQGYFSANAYNYLEGSVNVPGFPKPVLLLGREAMNRSVQGDLVVVELFPEAEWKAPADAVIDADCKSFPAQRNDNPDDSASEGEQSDNEDAIQAKERQAAIDTAARNPKEKQPTGRVVGVMKRNWRAYVCHIDRSSLSTTSSTLSAQTVFATPVDRALPRIRLRTRQAPELLGQKILVSLDKWDAHSRYPDGHFVRALGKAESKEAERESLLLEFDVPYRPFGRAILDCLPKEGDKWVVPPKEAGRHEWRDREDLRELIICSIDPPNCQDIDDALHARQLPNGNIEAGVHIADVSHFVHSDTPMDNEAAARGTTVYLVDKRIDMLPSLLGTNLCSLRPYVERLAFSAIWELTPDADIVNVRFTKSVIASKAAFTYEEAQIRKDDPTLNDELTQSIRLLNSLALKLKAKRMAAGALNLASPEVKIHLDSAESSDPIDVEQKELRETNSLVEEFMLLANVSVARQIQESFPGTAVLRRHMPPPHSNFEKLQDLLMKLKGMTLDVSSSGALAASLDKCIDPNEPAFNTLVRIMATRCMLSAEYFCAGSVSRETFGHYGLASPIYTHFTSPIRRYAGKAFHILAHRQLSAAIGYTPLHATLQTKSHVEQTMSVINRRHRLAQMAGRASVEFYVGLALKARNLAQQDNQGVVEDAFVIRAFRNGLAVFVSKLGIEGLVTFKNEQEFDPESYSVTLPGPNGGVKVAVFDRVRVKIRVEQDKNTLRGKVKMTLLSPVDTTAL